MSGFTETEYQSKHLEVRVQSAGNRLTIDLLLWFAREAEKAVAAGMPRATEVRIDKEKLTLSASHVIKYELKPEGAEE